MCVMYTVYPQVAKTVVGQTKLIYIYFPLLVYMHDVHDPCFLVQMFELVSYPKSDCALSIQDVSARCIPAKF